MTRDESAAPTTPASWAAHVPVESGDDRWRAVRRRRPVAVTGHLAWTPVLGLALVLLLGEDSAAGQLAVLLGSVSLLVLLLARLLLAAVVWREQRQALLCLAAALALYAAGGVALGSAPDADVFAFPGPGTGFFLAGSALMAGYLALQGWSKARLSVGTALEALITCGGAACLVGAVLLVPVTDRLDRSGIPLLGALIYPVLDLVMTLIVIATASLQGTLRSAKTGRTLLGFVLLTLADLPLLAAIDSSLLDRVARAGFDVAGGLYVLWGSALVLIVSGACTPFPDRATSRQGGVQMVPPVGAAVLAVVVLALRPPDGASTYVTAPAVITLLASAARLALALSEARRAAEAYRLSLTDELTGLPNRRAVVLRLEEAAGEEAGAGLLVLDLDRFGEANDTLGSEAGDLVLRRLADRLRSWLPPTSMVARVGGDEFAVLTPTDDEALLAALAGQLRDLVRSPVPEFGSYLPSAAVGISVAGPAQPAGDVLRRAGVALRQAKESQEHVVHYDPDKDGLTVGQLATADRLRHGIPAGELTMWYQPQVDASGGAVHGLEALVRWHHPDLGLVAPAEFLGVARATGLMPRLSEEVVDLVLADVERWSDQGIRTRISFNLAPPELLNPLLLDHVLGAIARSRVPAGSLVVEITEDSFLADQEGAKRALREFARHEVQVAIDDYGTGFSSLQYLRDLPVHELKMDRSFVHAVDVDERSRIIVESTNQMAHGLGMRTVAEGVEDEAAAGKLAALGVDILQGYHFARPMPARDVETWLREWEVRRSATMVPLPRSAGA